jgi:hypothetical protein
VEDLVAWTQVLRCHRIILLAHYTLEPLPEERWVETFQRELEDQDSLFKAFVLHKIAFEDWGKLNASFGFEEYRKGGGDKLHVGSLLDLEFKDERLLVEPFAQRLLAIAQELYPLARPTYGEINGGWGEWDTADVFRLRLKHISWVNFFGPAYVEKYGQDFLLGLPGYKTEVLPDGGVFHQLSPTFVAPSEQEAKRLRRWVIAYCAEHDLKVTCRAPYVIPGLTLQPEPKEPATDAEVQEYLQQALAVTLVLDDGTRVKPIYIPWHDLTLQQQQMALEAIKRAAIAEIKRPGRERIRLEFNEIPDELDQMLVALVGRDNPDFEWVQVEMEP